MFSIDHKYEVAFLSSGANSKQFKFDLILNLKSTNEEDKLYKFSNNFQLDLFPSSTAYFAGATCFKANFTISKKPAWFSTLQTNFCGGRDATWTISSIP